MDTENQDYYYEAISAVILRIYVSLFFAGSAGNCSIPYLNWQVDPERFCLLTKWEKEEALQGEVERGELEENLISRSTANTLPAQVLSDLGLCLTLEVALSSRGTFSFHYLQYITDNEGDHTWTGGMGRKTTPTLQVWHWNNRSWMVQAKSWMGLMGVCIC